jgi:ankyrin repeat protein
MLESIVYYTQLNGFQEDTIPALFTNKSFYNNPFLWNKIINNKRNLTPLMNACFINKASRVKFLLDAGANVNLSDSNRQTALLYAYCGKTKHSPHKCEDCNLKIIESLCKNNINLNHLDIDGENAIMSAIKLGYTNAIKIFCNYNFDINYTNPEGKTAMILAIENNHPKMCYYLWKKGADINTVDEKKHTFLMTLVYNDSSTYEMIEDVLKHYNLINAIDDNGNSALMYAHKYTSIDIVKLLIKYNADVSYSLVNAIFNSNIKIVNELCSLTTNLDYTRLITFAKKYKSRESIKILLKFQKNK